MILQQEASKESSRAMYGRPEWEEHLLREMSTMKFREAVMAIPSIKVTAENIRDLKGWDDLRIDLTQLSHQQFKPTMSNNINSYNSPVSKELAPLREQHASLHFYGDSLRRNEETLETVKQVAELLTNGRPNAEFTRIDLVVETGAGLRNVLRVSVGNNTKSLPQVVEAAKAFLEVLRQATITEVVATAEATADAANQLVKFSTEQHG